MADQEKLQSIATNPDCIKRWQDRVAQDDSLMRFDAQEAEINELRATAKLLQYMIECAAQRDDTATRPKPWNERMGVMVGEQISPASAYPFMKEEILEWRARTAQSTPIKMILYCPRCHAQHIDAPEYAGTNHTDGSASMWDNPPHRSHLCHHCNHIWRPADVPTEGVAQIETRGRDQYTARSNEQDIKT